MLCGGIHVPLQLCSLSSMQWAQQQCRIVSVATVHAKMYPKFACPLILVEEATPLSPDLKGTKGIWRRVGCLDWKQNIPLQAERAKNWQRLQQDPLWTQGLLPSGSAPQTALLWVCPNTKRLFPVSFEHRHKFASGIVATGDRNVAKLRPWWNSSDFRGGCGNSTYASTNDLNRHVLGHAHLTMLSSIPQDSFFNSAFQQKWKPFYMNSHTMKNRFRLLCNIYYSLWLVVALTNHCSWQCSQGTPSGHALGPTISSPVFLGADVTSSGGDFISAFALCYS